MTTVNEMYHSIQIEILQVSKLKSIFTSEFFIYGIPWKVQVYKNEKEGDDRTLAVRLICINTDKTSKWSISGALSCKLLSLSDDLDALENYFGPYVFDRTTVCGFGLDELIQWNDLLNEDSKYVKDDTMKLEFKIVAENPNDPNKSGVQFECIGECCDCNCLATFQLTITNISNLMAVRAPRYGLRGLYWSIAIGKDRESNLFAHLDFDEPTNKILCKVIMSIKLLSSRENVNSIEKTRTKQLLSSEYLVIDNILSWNELFKPENVFVNENSITLEVSINTKQLTPIDTSAKIGLYLLRSYF